MGHRTNTGSGSGSGPGHAVGQSHHAGPNCTFDAIRSMTHRAEIDLESCLRAPYSKPVADALARHNKHLGQRKLLLSEVQLLTAYYARHKVHPLVVYIGAAPGIHTAFLLQLFPHLRFVLYDGADFDRRVLHATPEMRAAIVIRQELFNGLPRAGPERQALLDGWGLKKKQPLVLISDIRSGASDTRSSTARYLTFEAQVAQDMRLQRSWVEQLRPTMSLLKFRLPYTTPAGDKIPYLPGTLLFGIWPKPDSGETRLLVRDADLDRGDAQYDFTAYEQVLFFHNVYTRSACFARAVPPSAARLVSKQGTGQVAPPPSTPAPAPAYCTCYDCVAELKVYAEYVAKALPKQLVAATTASPAAMAAAAAFGRQTVEAASTPAGGALMVAVKRIAAAAAASASAGAGPAAALEEVVRLYGEHMAATGTQGHTHGRQAGPGLGPGHGSSSSSSSDAKRADAGRLIAERCPPKRKLSAGATTAAAAARTRP
jgi:hypothetical protein